MDTVIFTIPGVARGKQRPRATRQGRVYTPAQTVNAEAYVKMLAVGAMNGEKPFEGALEATFNISVAIPKSFTRRDRERIEKRDLWPTSKPDIDNVVKLLCDAMNGICYGDDKQIVDLLVTKSYAANAETVVMITKKGTDHERNEGQVSAT